VQAAAIIPPVQLSAVVRRRWRDWRAVASDWTKWEVFIRYAIEKDHVHRVHRAQYGQRLLER
jgi:hypothetical protein